MHTRELANVLQERFPAAPAVDDYVDRLRSVGVATPAGQGRDWE
jgi:hypothetical protein